MPLARSNLSFGATRTAGDLNASVTQCLYKFGFEQDKDRRLYRRGLRATGERQKAPHLKVCSAAAVGIL